MKHNNQNQKIENILIEEFYSGNKLKLKDLFDDEKYIIINICIYMRRVYIYI